MAHYKPHDWVDVYHDPIDQQDPEGRAEVVRHMPECGVPLPGFGWYLVNFKGESRSESVQRMLKEPNREA